MQTIYKLLNLIKNHLLLNNFREKKRGEEALDLIITRNKILNNRKLKIAEIGVFRGDFSAVMLEKFKFFEVELTLIDPYIANSEFIDYSQDLLDKAYNFCCNRFKKFSNVKIIKDSSENSVKNFEDNYFDFIYLDGNHNYSYVKQDLEMWYPKLKNKGIICGDDWSRPYGVMKAATEFAYKNNLYISLTNNYENFFFIKDNN